MNTEITLAVAELKEALPGLTKVIGKSRTLPVLQTVRIARNREGLVTLQATDLDSFATYTFKEAQQGPPEDVLVPVDQLTKAAKCSSPKEEIGIVAESKDKVKLRYNIGGNMVQQTITTLPVDEYPPAPRFIQPGVELEPQFGQALREALACCSEDSSRYVLQGACLDVSDKKYHYVVGTNGRTLFSANSFCFNLQKSVIIPDSKFLDWSDFLDEQPAFLSVEPGKERVPAKKGQPAQEALAGWVKLESPRWTFVAREIDGEYPNWRECVPTPNSTWTKVMLSEEAIAQLLLVIPKLPGLNSPHSTVRLRVDSYLNIEGPNKDQDEWTSIPVQNVAVTGKAVTIAFNRQYLLTALKFGLSELQINTSLTPMVLSKGGKRMVIMPVNLEKPTPTATDPSQQPALAPEATTPTPAAAQNQPPTETGAPTEERKGMPRQTRATTPGPMTTFQPVATHPANNNGDGNGNGAAVKPLIEQVEQIKENLKNVIRDLTNVTDSVKAAEKDKRATDKEIEAVRTKLRQIQNVTI